MEYDIAVVDLRDAGSYARERPVGAVRLGAQDLCDRPHFLPPRRRPLVLVGDSATRLEPICRALETAGRRIFAHYPLETWKEHLPRETGPPSRLRLWEPARVVEQALEADIGERQGARSPRRVLDLACGTGRNAVFLALAGYDVTAVDVLPDALQRARELAAHHEVPLRTLERDLEEPGALHGLDADLIVVVRFLARSLFPKIEAALRPGGILAYETFTEVQRQAGHPRNPRFLLRPGELCRAFPGLEILHHESVGGEAHLERLVARRAAASGS